MAECQRLRQERCQESGTGEDKEDSLHRELGHNMDCGLDQASPDIGSSAKFRIDASDMSDIIQAKDELTKASAREARPTASILFSLKFSTLRCVFRFKT